MIERWRLLRVSLLALPVFQRLKHTVFSTQPVAWKDFGASEVIHVYNSIIRYRFDVTRDKNWMNMHSVRNLSLASYLCLLNALLLSAPSFADFDHGIWDNLLRENLTVLRDGQATQVDYQAMEMDRDKLRSYLDQLSAISQDQFESWEQQEQLAFLINAYNAWTVELILKEGPDLDSIRDIGFLPNAAWRIEFISLFDEQVSLDDIEHGMIRGWGRYNEPRIHFAVNCAAIGCPALRNEAYNGDKLSEQLEDSTRRFLSDRSRNYKAKNRLYISRIFDWYEEDFEQGWQGIDSVTGFVLGYADAMELTEQDVRQLQQREWRIRYADYDWGLNRVPGS